MAQSPAVKKGGPEGVPSPVHPDGPQYLLLDKEAAERLFNTENQVRLLAKAILAAGILTRLNRTAGQLATEVNAMLAELEK